MNLAYFNIQTLDKTDQILEAHNAWETIFSQIKNKMTGHLFSATCTSFVHGFLRPGQIGVLVFW